ncbi:maltooligosyl trehalose synthase [Rhizobium sp. RU20A]|uniref:malto-oligosyltrehalose synthase n=1 Tax=Rhizobium sp. RU20A TaxID=1907412 RepID=UPI0009557EFB|nr:malto-oligosyltrehalose synthase [Rhizobium sp. RU20A]SIQ97023.1 maltooligosyl trehalose synthase [Rhizobium sp. RU20A]
MPLPTATYRLQFRNGMTFDAARTRIPAIKALGVSHLYASPIFTATSGSTHGYDVTDANAIDPALGGAEGLEALSRALKEAGLGLMIDIVPNHMASSLENAWWKSVVRHGADSPFAGHFDIDWSQRLTLPFLGEDAVDAVAEGKIRLGIDPQDHGPSLMYYDTAYPLTPQSWSMLAEALPDPEAATALAALAEAAGPGADWPDERLAALAPRLEGPLDALSGNTALIAALHDAQPYVLTNWRTACKSLTYRRFFEVTGLVGLRVEDPAVFEDAHRLILDLVRRGVVDGLRVDHVDGLADPAAYLQRLRAAVGPDVTIVVEKILEEDESIPSDWPIEGTTGYEFITALTHLLVDETDTGVLHRAFADASNDERPLGVQALEAKDLMLEVNFEGEVRRLSALLAAASRASGSGIEADAFAEAVRAMIRALPVYRTYVTEEGPSEADCRRLASIRETAAETVTGEAARKAVDFVARLMATPLDGVDADAQLEIRTRFQQLSGPIMAKAMEDTLFYRYGAMLALNEVGGNPGQRPGGPVAFHTRMVRRQADMPHALSATSTHDTKRGEDARARLATLSEMPALWIAAVTRWRRLNAPLVPTLARGPAPEASVEWTLYQAMLGAWPIEGRQDPEFAGLAERFDSYVEKMLREAKMRTNWGAPDEAYEKAVRGFARHLLDPDASAVFLADFEKTAQPFLTAGLVNSLSQTVVKLMAPGIPDVYAGSEQADFSLVDPDNRRPLPPPVIPPAPAPMPTPQSFTRYKAALIRRLLSLRTMPQVREAFAGDYRPLAIEGPAARHFLAFERRGRDCAVITVVPRCVAGRLVEGTLMPDTDLTVGADIALPFDLNGRLINALSGERVDASFVASVGSLLGDHPVAVLATE